MASVFLFGAGASFGSGRCFPHPPPLGFELFDKVTSGALRGVAESDESLAAAFRSNFEVGMDRFYEERHWEVVPLLRGMARYFADFRLYPRDKENLYGRLLDVLHRKRETTTFVSTNYEMLLELAALDRGLKIAYHGLPVPTDHISVLKIHGSCNFLPDLGQARLRYVGFDVRSRGAEGVMVDAPVRVVASPEEVFEFCFRENSLAPALALYSPSKQVLFGPRFVRAQQSAWTDAAMRAETIFVIGLRVHPIDEHLWGTLARSRAALFYVGAEDAIVQWAAAEKRKHVYPIAETFAEAFPMIARHFA